MLKLAQTSSVTKRKRKRKKEINQSYAKHGKAIAIMPTF
jgi:hypothetical protein